MFAQQAREVVMHFDVSTDEGFGELEQRAAHDAWATITDERWNDLAGVDLRQLARELADDFMQQIVTGISMPAETIGDQQYVQFAQQANRNVYAHLVYEGLVWVVCEKMRTTSILPAGRSAKPPQLSQLPQLPQSPKPPRRKRQR
jgi:hypothetical protein